MNHVPGEASIYRPGALRVSDDETVRVGDRIHARQRLVLSRSFARAVQVQHEGRREARVDRLSFLASARPIASDRREAESQAAAANCKRPAAAAK